MPGLTNKVRYYCNHKGYFYDLHFRQMMVPMYVGDFEGNLKALNTKYGLNTYYILGPKKKDKLDH